MESKIKDILYEPFDDIKSRRGRGGTYDYVTWKNVADRMNEVFGMNWSSEVQHQEMIGENVIIRVSVCAFDAKLDKSFCQEGYGGATLRPSDEPGSAHKSAYSKALKDACKKWGIGLHLEEGSSTNSSNSNGSNVPKGYTGQEMGQQKAPTIPQTPSAPQKAQVQGSPTVPTQQIPTVPNQSAPMVPSSPTTQAPPIPQAPVSNIGAPIKPVSQALPPTPGSINKVVIDTPNTASTEDTAGTITNVQQMAIKNLARLNTDDGISVDEFLKNLIVNPDCELTREVSSLEDLSYNEAVFVIKATKK